MNLPCKQNKCLKYPACKNKQFITCTPLREYCDEIIQTTPFIQDGKDLWDILYNEFPEIIGVDLDQPPKDSNITSVKDLLINRRKIPMELIKNIAWESRYE